ncbi:MAG: glycosyltransferase family 29 protein [Paracoccaceae bacterium]
MPPSRLSFLIARSLRREAALMRLSVPRAALAAQAAGQRIALVGNARALSSGDSGAAIDRADMVVRINRAPTPSTRTHGMRTDWLMLAASVTSQDLTRIRPGRILWMSPKRKRLSWGVSTSPGFYLHPRADHTRLRDALGAPPTTGLLAIDLLLSLNPASLTLYGFDFFASLSLTGSRKAAQVPHDFAAEKAWVEARAARDPRLRFG